MKKKNEESDEYSKEIINQLLKVSAHQLRAPISTIQTQLKTILAGYAGEVPGKIKRLLDGAYRKSSDMLTLLNDLLELARIEDKNIKDEFEPVNLEQIFNKTIENLSAKAELKELDFQISKSLDLPVVWGYKIGLRNLFHNLIENAIKYTPKGGRVYVKINYNKKQGMLECEIKDTGIGISEKDSKNIFTEFYRAANAKHEDKLGTGLGLTIVAKSIEIHGGDIEVDSKIGAGTTFEFSIPLVKISSIQLENDKKKYDKKRLKIVVIGGRAAGPKAAAKARRMDENAKITIIEKERVLSYAGCGLPYYISGMVSDPKELMTTNDGDIRDPEFFRKIKEIDVLNRTKAVDIDRKKKKIIVENVRTCKRREFDYDKLVIATGSKSVIPKIAGVHKNGVYTLHGVADAKGLREELRENKAKDVVIIGGGLLGIETAEALSIKGARVTIIESTNQILSFLDKEIAFIVQNYFEHKGIRVLLNSKVEKIIGKNSVKGVIANSKTIPADFIILSVGVIPEVTLAKNAGLELGVTGAIKVNEYLQTSDQDIYAVGDCIENNSLITGKPIYSPFGSIANKQGRIVGLNVTGSRVKLHGVLQNIILKAFDYNIAAVGLTEIQSEKEGFTTISAIVPGPDKEHYYSTAKLIYLKLIGDKKTGRIIGAQIVGRGDVSKRIDVIATIITGKMKMWDLSKLDLAYAPPYSSAMDIVITAANVLKNKYYENFIGIAPFKLKEKLNNEEDILLLDVRTPAEYDYISIPSSILIPLNSLRGRIRSIPKDREIIIYCRSGVNSYEAFRFLKAKGFNDVKVLDGGILAYFGEIY